MSELSPRQHALKEEFTRARGYWSPVWDQVLALDPDFFEAYLNFSSVPWRNGVLEPKVREFIYIAIDASTTHLHAAGTRTHMRNALRLGATRQEIMEVLQLISVLGIHSVTDGVPILIEEMATAGRGAELPKPGAGGEREARLKAEFTAARGYWSELWDSVLALSPDFFEAYMRFSSVPWKHGTLEPKEGVHLRRHRCCNDASLRTRHARAHPQCHPVWRHAPGNHGGAGAGERARHP